MSVLVLFLFSILDILTSIDFAEILITLLLMLIPWRRWISLKRVGVWCVCDICPHGILSVSYVLVYTLAPCFSLHKFYHVILLCCLHFKAFFKLYLIQFCNFKNLFFLVSYNPLNFPQPFPLWDNVYIPRNRYLPLIQVRNTTLYMQCFMLHSPDYYIVHAR